MNDESRELIKHRLAQAETALDDAQFLLEGNRSPQSIINRSYYAMFYATLALLQKIEKVPSKHTGAISLFDREFVAKGVFASDFSKDFHKAFTLRQSADYRIIASPSYEEAGDTYQAAGRFVAAVREYLQQQLK